MSPEIEHALKAGGRRLTYQRRLVVRELECSRNLTSAEQIYGRIKPENPEIGLSTVYRTLGLLVRLGIAHKKSFGDGRALYGLCTGGNRQYARCDCCGAMIEFEESLTDYLTLQLERDRGFVAHACELTLHGQCPACSASPNR